MHDVLELAKQAARAGGEVIARAGANTGDIRVKGAATDMVTEIDIAAGVEVVRTIATAHGTARFVIEEDEVYELAHVDRGRLDDSEVWVVDPLDGTTSFIHGFPCFSVAVALLREGEPAVGAVYNVPSDELFSAARGEGAFRNDQPVGCSQVASVTDALLITGFPYDRTTTLDRQLEMLERFLRAPVQGIRRDGSAAVDCCHVAAGRADGFWEFGLHAWDTAAGVAILREAGAEVTGVDGAAWTPDVGGILAANPALHEAMLEVMQG